MSVKYELTPFSADYVAKLLRELESRGWQPDQRGDAECVDEASAAAADYIKRLLADIATLRQQAEAMRAVLAKCVRDFEDMGEDMPTSAGCIECTAGTVPNHLNKGRCGYHAAKAELRYVCEGCGNEIDLDYCGCGSPITHDAMDAGHAPIPMGCDCFRAPTTPGDAT